MFILSANYDSCGLSGIGMIKKQVRYHTIFIENTSCLEELQI
jgi:hypothetical protein